MRRIMFVMLMAGVMAGMLAAPVGAAAPTVLDGPTAFWISDPDGPGGVGQLDPVDGASGAVRVNDHGATIRATAAGLEPGHTYTMWVVYFSDQTACGDDGCNDGDLADPDVAAGVLFGAGTVAGGDGTASFAARLRTGDGADALGPPPPPFAFAPYRAGPDNEFHIVVRSHGPKVPGEVADQIHSFLGGCEVEVGPAPGEVGDFPVPSAPGECGDVQVHIYS